MRRMIVPRWQRRPDILCPKCALRDLCRLLRSGETILVIYRETPAPCGGAKVKRPWSYSF
jgi:hypothetical protein